MSELASKAVGGAGWTIATSVFSRALGLVGTLVITYFIDQDVLGEVANAFVLIYVAHQFSTFGIGPYLLAHPKAGRDVWWHATVMSLGIGAVAIGGVVLVAPRFGWIIQSPKLSSYLPGLGAAMFIERVSVIPERLLIRKMQFRVLGLWRTASEITYSVTSLALAVAGLGGLAIVLANVARSSVLALGIFRNTSARDWLTPSPLSRATFKSFFQFGVPLSIAAGFNTMSRRVDNLVISALFGTAVVGQYNLAYNLADVPAVQIGYQIGDVLMPAFAQMEAEERKRELVRSTGMLALVVFPLAIGLGAIAVPVVAALLHPRWAAVAPMLSVLSLLAVSSPIGWTIMSYLQAQRRTRTIMILEGLKVVVLLAAVYALGRIGVLWACGGVSVAFAAHALASMWTIYRLEGIPVRHFLVRCLLPLLACVVMVVAIVLFRWFVAMPAGMRPTLELSVEIVLGGLAYVAGAYVFAGAQTRELVDLVKTTIARKRGKDED